MLKTQVKSNFEHFDVISIILDKTVEKIAYLGRIFSKLRGRPIPPSPLPLKAVLLGLQRKPDL